MGKLVVYYQSIYFNRIFNKTNKKYTYTTKCVT